MPEIKHAYYGEISGEDPEWVSGYVYSQDPAAMFPAAISTVKPGEKVLDLCAAPGGKTTALGEQLKIRVCLLLMRSLFLEPKYCVKCRALGH